MRIFYASIVLVYAAVMLYAWQSQRMLIGESSEWIYWLVNNGSINIPHGFLRHAVALFQIPSLLVLYFQKFSSGKIFLAEAVNVYTLVLAIHPLISLATVYIFLTKKNRRDLFVFPFLSFVAASFAVMSFPVAVVLFSLSFFWPLFFLLYFYEKFSYKSVIQIFLLYLAFITTYEAVIIVLPFLAFYAYLNIKSNRQADFNKFILVTSLVSIAILVYQLLRKNVSTAAYYYFDAFKHGINISHLILIVGAILIVFLIALNLRNKNYSKVTWSLIGVFFIISTGVYTVIYTQNDAVAWPSLSINAYNGNSARLLALPIALLLAAALIYFDRYSRQRKNLPNILKSNWVCIGLTYISVISILTDLRYTELWKDGHTHLKNISMVARVGCINLSETEYNNSLLKSNIPPFALPYTSILIQVLSSNSEIRSVVFTSANSYNGKPERNACEELQNNTFVSNQYKPVTLNFAEISFAPSVLSQLKTNGP